MKYKLVPSLAFAVLAAPAVASEWQFSGSTAAGYNSIYEFRGVDLGSHMVEASAAASVTFDDLVITGSAWYASVNDNQNNPTPDELDLTLSLSKPLGPVTLTAGYIGYIFNGDVVKDTSEIYLGASMNIGAGILATLTGYRDVDYYDAWYVDFNLSRNFEISECLDAAATIGCGYADGHGWQLKDNGGSLDSFQHVYFMLSLPWEFRTGVTLAPYAKYVITNHNLVTDVPGNSTGDDHFVYGVKLTVTF